MRRYTFTARVYSWKFFFTHYRGRDMTAPAPTPANHTAVKPVVCVRLPQEQLAELKQKTGIVSTSQLLRNALEMYSAAQQ